jgi:UDP:flavonoid glycosyltransferase YjiC (YdhE family)
MNIAIITIGTRGDIVPHIALSQSLMKSGHDVRLTTHLAFKTLVQRYNIPFFALDDEPKELAFPAEGGERFMELIILRIIESTPLYMQRAEEACQEADLIIAAFPCFLMGHAVAEKYQKRLVMTAPQPLLLSTTAFPEPTDFRLPQYPGALDKNLNQRSHSKAQQDFTQLFLPPANSARRSLFNLPPLPDSFYTNLPDASELILCGYSSLLLPKPADWSEKIHLTGFWTLGHQEGWQPESELVDFLRAGPAPIYIGFGSMRSYQPVETVELVEEALRQIGQRGILLVDSDVYHTHRQSNTLYLTTETAHDWLFPQVQAIVHHGGAGTTVASLQAGQPIVTVPFIAEQFFWGTLVARAGVGPYPIDRTQLTAKKLAQRLEMVLHNTAMKCKARELGERLSDEKGAEQAVKAINSLEALSAH